MHAPQPTMETNSMIDYKKIYIPIVCVLGFVVLAVIVTLAIAVAIFHLRKK